jgi:hypothetical protein
MDKIEIFKEFVTAILSVAMLYVVAVIFLCL